MEDPHESTPRVSCLSQSRMLQCFGKQGEPANPKATPFFALGMVAVRHFLIFFLERYIYVDTNIFHIKIYIVFFILWYFYLFTHAFSIPGPFNFNFLNKYFTPQQINMFETNPETCFVHGLCPPTSTPLSPTIISICSGFNLNFLKISPQNEACFRLTPKHASYMASVHPDLPPRIISICSYFNLNFLRISPQNEACFRLTRKHASYMASARPHLPPFPPRSSPSAAASTEYVTPKRNMFQTNPETCFVHGLCPPTSTPLSPRIISIHLQLLQPQFPENFIPKRAMFETNPETCFVHGLCPPTSTPLSPRIISIHLQLLQPQFPENFTPKGAMFQTNPETFFVHGLCPPTSTPLSPTIISIRSPFNLNFVNGHRLIRLLQ